MWCIRGTNGAGWPINWSSSSINHSVGRARNSMMDMVLLQFVVQPIMTRFSSRKPCFLLAKSEICPARSELQWSDNPMFINVIVNFSLWTNMFPQNRASTFSLKDAPTCESPAFQTELQHKASKQSPYDQLLLFSHALYIWICIWEHHPIILPLMN